MKGVGKLGWFMSKDTNFNIPTTRNIRGKGLLQVHEGVRNSGGRALIQVRGLELNIG